MNEVASRDLRNNTRKLLDRVEQGERMTITVQGRPMAELRPVAPQKRWMHRGRFVREILSQQADPALSEELATLTEQTTEDLPWH